MNNTRPVPVEGYAIGLLSECGVEASGSRHRIRLMNGWLILTGLSIAGLWKVDRIIVTYHSWCVKLSHRGISWWLLLHNVSSFLFMQCHFSIPIVRLNGGLDGISDLDIL